MARLSPGAAASRRCGIRRVTHLCSDLRGQGRSCLLGDAADLVDHRRRRAHHRSRPHHLVLPRPAGRGGRAVDDVLRFGPVGPAYFGDRDDGRRCCGSGIGRGGEMDPRRSDPVRGASSVVVIHLAQRGRRLLRRTRGRSLVRPERRGHACDRVVPAGDGREDRPRSVVRELLAAGGRPRPPRRQFDGQPRLCGPDSPVP